MKGRRIYLKKGQQHLAFKPGDYGKDSTGEWLCRPPDPEIHLGSLRNHGVTEHEDGTITASPSILIRQGDGKEWHGYLEKGVWREC